jgi:hypothetical protein
MTEEVEIILAKFICIAITVVLLVTGKTRAMYCIMGTQRVAVKWEGKILELYHCVLTARKQGNTTSLRDADYRKLCVCVCVFVC